MGALNLAEWQKLPMSLTELCINTTLRCGQSFRWRKNDAGVWSMALHNRILTLHQDTDFLYYKSLPPSPPHAPPTPPNSHPPSVAPTEPPDDDTLELIKHYFNLTPNLSKLYEQWAKYLYQTACIVSEKGEGWLDALRNPESPTLGTKPEPAGEWKPEGRDGYRQAHEALLSLQGVGPKVADCVCLMGLGWGEAVPVDTHVWQIAQRDYKFGRGKHSSLTKQTYDAVGAKFRSLWGQEAGWAHSVLFTADLRAFSERLIAKKEEQKEDVEVKTEAGAEVEEDVTKVDKVLERGVKREPEEEEKKVVEVEEKVVRRTKRRRT
ncbi:hypothetical protein D0859_09000 [Hortaea werneckii]|uniref:DNA-(apurinic or apyrimidinic site) lyase n=1 Tax=Hortaea werneckii TaxID=91943 RepID=A0A3M7IND0_HORWE|nr:hypothetical protein D0859_09000 [Hortaea werneckii]